MVTAWSGPATPVLEAVFQRARAIHPTLTESAFLEHIIASWLEPYERGRPVLTKDKVRLRNTLDVALKVAGKTKTALATETGISRAYLGLVAADRCEPSVTVALLLANALGYPPGRFDNLFFLEPVP